jgi:predicted small lipoprotein YifL
MRLIAVLLLVIPLVAGCGKKGNLYLPDPGKSTTSQNTQQ